MKDYKTYIFDIDGTIVKQDEEVPGAIELVAYLKKQGKEVLYATNNPVTTKERIATRLNLLGFLVNANQIITPLDALELYFQESAIQPLFYGLVSQEVMTELQQRGFLFSSSDNEKVTHVLLGMNKQLTYQHFCEALFLLDQGAELLLLNGDLYCPVPKGRVPDSGALSFVLTAYMDERPDSVGKPTKWMQRTILNRITTENRDCLFIGDSLQSDIQIGHAMGMDTCLVESGISDFRRKVSHSTITPTFIMKNCEQLQCFIQKTKESSDV
ncbi:HAD-IIA family hydrolase [Alkalihalobacillus sp. LMS39]|uniref:HAD-IIA family hydrolase n=1 Tax=Alkalihalobacillus sp. LMS39 TaxID=2924032 RepID=UPI001FB4951E|nr:HAD-IIA family hydrolase [Alkalihalobacillus sp. LMS39]UOE94421.1 HAD-IIA family hydrolase [Alkalihalobacillus sp. LMS39]